MHSITAIIPAYNEQSTIAAVAGLVVDSGLFSEVICVNDGSTDATLDILKLLGRRIILISFPRNRGKGYAMAHALMRAKGEAVMFLDSDLVGLRKSHLRQMISALNGVDGVIGNPVPARSLKQSLVNPDLKRIVGLKYDIFSGQRLYYRRDILKIIGRIRKSGNADVAVLNDHYKHKKVAVIDLAGLYPRSKHEKTGIALRTFQSYAQEGLEITWELLGEQREQIITQLNPQIDRIRKKLKWAGRNLNP